MYSKCIGGEGHRGAPGTARGQDRVAPGGTADGPDGVGKEPMGDARKAFNSGTADKIFDRLTVLIMSQELLLQGSHGPLTDEQKKVLVDLLARAKDIAVLVRELTES